MPHLETYSTTLRDGEDLTKIQTWLGMFRKDEMIRFEVVRASPDTDRLLIQCDRSSRLKIVTSSPADGTSLKSGTAVAQSDFLFTEPVSEESLSGITLNGTPITSDKISVLNNGYRVKIDLTGFDLSLPGQYKFLWPQIKAQKGLNVLCGQRNVTWLTTEATVPGQGAKIQEQSFHRLRIARIPIEGTLTEDQMLLEFYKNRKVKPESVMALRFIRVLGFQTRTIIYVIWADGDPIPLLTSSTPSHGSTMVVDGATAPGFDVIMNFNYPLTVVPTVTIDDVPVPTVTLDPSGTRAVATVPSGLSHGNHNVLVTNIQNGSDLRDSPAMFCFSLQRGDVAATGVDDLTELTIWETLTPKDDGVRIYGSDPLFPGTPSFRSIGTGAGDLQVIPNANVNVDFFAGALPGQNPVVTLTGWSTAHGAIKTSTWGVDSSGNLVVASPNRALFNTPFGQNLALLEDGVAKLPTLTALPVATAIHEGGFIFRRGVTDNNVTRMYVGVRLS